MYFPLDIRITIDLFFGGLGVGLFLFVVLLRLYSEAHYEKLIKIGAVLAPALTAFGLLFLLWELGRTERFYMTMLPWNFNPYSAISWGGSIQGNFVFLAFLYAALLWIDWRPQPWFGIVETLAVIFAAGAGLFHGFLFSYAARPLWGGGLITVKFFFSALLAAAALVLLLTTLKLPEKLFDRFIPGFSIFNSRGRRFNIPALLLVLLLFQLVLVFNWQINIVQVGAEARESMQFMLEQYGTMWWLGAIGVGLVLPLLIVVVNFIVYRDYRLSYLSACVVAFLIIAGNFFYRHVIIMAGQVFIERWL